MAENDLGAPEREREVVEVRSGELVQVREAVPAVSLEGPTASSLPHSLPHWIAPRNPGFAPDSRSPTARLPARCTACVAPVVPGPLVPPSSLASLLPY